MNTAILYHIVQHSTTLYHIVPHCTTLYHNVPHCTTLYHIVPHCAILSSSIKTSSGMVRMTWMQCVCAMMLTAGSALSRQRPSGSSSFVKQVIVCILYAVEGLHLLIYIYKIYLSEKGGKRKMVRPCVLVGLNKDKRDAVTGNKGRVSSALRVHVHDPQCCCVSQKIMGGNRGLFTDTVEAIEAHYRYCRGNRGLIRGTVEEQVELDAVDQFMTHYLQDLAERKMLTTTTVTHHEVT